jgi:hypothetical protein
VWARKGLSGSGCFAQGFGMVPPEYRGVLLWTFNHCIVQGKVSDWDSNIYPQNAMLAFVNWPIGEKEKNPGEVFPPMVADRTWGQTWFRNRWQDADDIVISALPKGHGGYHKVPGGNVFIWGFKEKAEVPFAGKCTEWKEAKTGGVIVTEGESLGVDFSGSCGADGLVVLAGPGAATLKGGVSKIKAQSVTVGGKSLTVITVSGKGTHPEAKVEGDKVAIGKQTVAWDGKAIVFGTSAPGK